MKIYTKKGDEGQTSLVFGKKVNKDDVRIEAYGSVDELNSWLGLILEDKQMKLEKEFLIKIQNKLFIIGSNLASEKESDLIPKLKNEDIENLEKQIDNFEKELSDLTNFILPSGSELIAKTHIARTVCRRAERNIVKLKNLDEFNEGLILQYMNRLSDYLFVLSRKIAANQKITEVIWKE